MTDKRLKERLLWEPDLFLEKATDFCGTSEAKNTIQLEKKMTDQRTEKFVQVV